MEVYFVELRSTGENVIYNEQKAIASKYRKMAVITVSSDIGHLKLHFNQKYDL